MRGVAGLMLVVLLPAGLALAGSPVPSTPAATPPAGVPPIATAPAGTPQGAASSPAPVRAPDGVDRCDACSLRHKARAPRPRAVSQANP